MTFTADRYVYTELVSQYGAPIENSSIVTIASLIAPRFALARRVLDARAALVPRAGSRPPSGP